MIRIAQAASSETHSAYGTPPNQLRTPGKLDGELNVIPFYDLNPIAVFRAKDEKIRERIAQNAYWIVANGNYFGYGQQLDGPYARTGVFDALFSDSEHNPIMIKTLANCDCSSMVGAAVYFAGVYEPELRTMNTSTEPTLLMGTGAFIRLEDPELLHSAVGCRRGDIYWRSGHTFIVLDSDEHDIYTPARIENCSACNMRTGPSKDYLKIRELHVGDIVAKISTASNGWVQVMFEGDYGFVSPIYCKDMPEGYATGDVWLRKKAGVIKPETEIIVIPKGSTVYLTGATTKVGLTTWYECIYAGRRGWSSGKFIKEK